MVHGKCNTQQVLRPPFPQRFTYSSAYLRRKRSFHPLGFHTQRLSWRAGLASRWQRAWGRWVCSWSWRTWTGTWHKRKGNKWVSDRKATELEMNWELKWKRAEGTEGGRGGGRTWVCVCVWEEALAQLLPATMAWFMSIWFSLGLRLPTSAEQDLSLLAFQYTAAQQWLLPKTLFHWPIF